MNHDGDRHAVHTIVRGRVQGVGFRFFVRDLADELGLSGWVRNSPDGRSVEVIAEGAVDELERLLERLNAGPPGAHVEQVETRWIRPQGEQGQFEIRR